MINKTLLISESDLKILIPDITSSIDNKLISNCILNAQEIDLKSTIGTSYFNSIVSGITYSSLSSDDDYVFYNYLIYIIAYSAYKRLILSTSYQLENSGLRIKESTSSTPADQTSISYIINNINSIVDHYRLELNKYMCEYNSLFPLYWQHNDLDINHKKNYSGSPFSFSTLHKKYRGYENL